MFEYNINIIKMSFQDYVGSGMYIGLFFVAMLYLFIKEKNKNTKMFTVGFPLCIFIIVLNPVFSKVVEKVFHDKVYWRMFWMLPIGLVLAYVGVRIIDEMKTKKDKMIVGLSLVVITSMCGKFIYTTDNYDRARNWYKIPNEAVEIAEIIEKDDTIVKNVFAPTDLVPYLRQITSNINLMYGRSSYGYEGSIIIPELEAGNVRFIANIFREKNCNYIIVSRDVNLKGNFEHYSFYLFAQTDSYDIYKQKDMIEVNTNVDRA